MGGALRKGRRVLAWVLVLALLYTLLPDQGRQVLADTAVELVLQEPGKKEADTGSETTVDVNLGIPAGCQSTAGIREAGINRMEVVLKVTGYTAADSGTPGLQPYFGYGKTWGNTKGTWVNLEKDKELTVSLSLTPFLGGGDSEVWAFGIQFANVKGKVTYEIISAKLTGTKSASGGDEGGSGGAGDNTYQSHANFAKLLQYSLYFYDANMCGGEVAERSLVAKGKKYGDYEGYRGNCHICDEEADYNGKKVDVSGGYHDAGDHAKFNLPQAYAATTLGLSYAEFRDAYESTGQVAHFKTIMEHFCDYFVRCTVLNAAGDGVEAYCYQVGNGETDHSYWGAPENQDSRSNQAYFTSSGTPCTDIVGQTAAALAVQAFNFPDDPKSGTYLECARRLFAYAEANPKKPSAGSMAGSFYSGTCWEDDLSLAAYWLYRATGEETYQSKAAQYAPTPGFVNCWDDMKAAAAAYSKGWDSIRTCIDSEINGKSLSDGYTYILAWGSARYNTALQFEALCYDKNMNTGIYTDWAKKQMNYLLGDNSMNQCFVVGYNEISSKYPHHRAASGCNSYGELDSGSLPNQRVLLGALCGGLSGGDAGHETAGACAQTKNHSDGTHFYHDGIKCYTCNEVTLDYNASLVAAAAGLYSLSRDDGKQMLDTDFAIDATADCPGNKGGIETEEGTPVPSTKPGSSATPSMEPGASQTPGVTPSAPSESVNPGGSQTPGVTPSVPSGSMKPGASQTPGVMPSVPSESVNPGSSQAPGVTPSVPSGSVKPGGSQNPSGNPSVSSDSSDKEEEDGSDEMEEEDSSDISAGTEGGVGGKALKLSRKKLKVKRGKMAKVTISGVAKKTKVKLKYPKKKLKVKLVKNAATKKTYKITGKKKGKSTVTFTVGRKKLKLSVRVV